MKKTRDDLQIEMMDYLYGEMGPAQATQFEEALADHPDLQEELQALKGTLESLSPLETEMAPVPPAQVKYAVMREARKRLVAPKSLSWTSRLLQTLTQPAMGTAFLALVVTGIGVTQMEWGIHEEIGQQSALMDKGVEVPSTPPHAAVSPPEPLAAKTSRPQVEEAEEFEEMEEVTAEAKDGNTLGEAIPKEGIAGALPESKTIGTLGSTSRGKNGFPPFGGGGLSAAASVKKTSGAKKAFKPRERGVKFTPSILPPKQKETPQYDTGKTSSKPLSQEVEAPQKGNKPKKRSVVIDAPRFLKSKNSKKTESKSYNRPEAIGVEPEFARAPTLEPAPSAISDSDMEQMEPPTPAAEESAASAAPKKVTATGDSRISEGQRTAFKGNRKHALALFLQILSERSEHAPRALIVGMETFAQLNDVERAKELLMKAELTGNPHPSWSGALGKAREIFNMIE